MVHKPVLRASPDSPNVLLHPISPNTEQKKKKKVGLSMGPRDWFENHWVRERLKVKDLTHIHCESPCSEGRRQWTHIPCSLMH